MLIICEAQAMWLSNLQWSWVPWMFQLTNLIM